MKARTPPLIHLFSKQLLGAAPCQALGEDAGREQADAALFLMEQIAQGRGQRTVRH